MSDNMAEISEMETQRHPVIPSTPIPDRESIDSPTVKLTTSASRKTPSKTLEAVTIQPATKPVLSSKIPKTGKGGMQAHLLRERCRQLGLALFVDERTTVQSLGITSSIEGEGKSFLSQIMAQVLAEDGFAPVVLVECNWEHPTQHQYFNLPPTPGLAEWLRDECDEKQIRHRIGDNLTVIPAGQGQADAVRLLRKLRDQGINDTLAHHSDILILDLPAVLTTAYGTLAASLPEALLMVTRAGSTPGPLLAEALGQLADLSVKSVILNQVESKIPRWIRQLF